MEIGQRKEGKENTMKFYLWTLDSHELHGPFDMAADATAYAFTRSLTSYQILSDAQVESYMFNSLR